MRDKQRRAPQSIEDKILGMVFDRLRNNLKVRYEDISEWSKDQGQYISVSCLCDLASGCATNYMSRIPIVARYFREMHGLEYVTADYMLQGSQEELDKVQRHKDVQRLIEDSIVPLPMEELIEAEAV